VIVLVDHSRQQLFIQQVLLLLMEQSSGCMSLLQLQANYQELCSTTLDLRHALENELKGIIELVSKDGVSLVKLCPLQMFARDVRSLLLANQNHIPLCNFEAAFSNFFGVNLIPASYGFPTTVDLLFAIPHVVSLHGKGLKRMVWLQQSFQSEF
jgi:hypothetical protein